MDGEPRAETVSAREHERLRRDLAELSERFAATNEVLTAVGKTAGDPDAVLATVVENACRLCNANACQLYLFDGSFYRLSRSVGLADSAIAYLGEHPLLPDRNTLAGRVGLDREIQQIPDVLADPDYGRRDLAEMAGFRTTMSAPLILDDDVVGALSLWRYEVDPFDEREVAILGTFTGQAAIALRNVDLVQQLGRKIDQLEALSAVGDAVSSSLDPDEVLATIVSHAVSLSDTDGGSMMEYSEAERSFSVRYATGTDQATLDQLKALRIRLEETLVGRAAIEGRPLVVTDLAEVTRDPHLEVLYANGWRSVVVVPMLREGRIVGGLVIRRKRPGDFSEDTLDLLETFASQSALALLNARLFRELEDKTAELEVASRHKSEFLASMSHELRTPLNAVLGFSEVLLERLFGEINERQEDYLRDIWSSGKHLLELLNEILDLSKVEAGQMDLEYSTFELRSSLDHAAAMMRERANAHGIQIAVEVAEGIDVIEADELRFRQVVVNLVSNAVKFTPDGGRVTMTAQLDDDEVVIAVADTGIGVPPEDVERIFDSFQQGGRGPSREEGTGLGLTLSRRIVELLGGRMWLESVVGVGSTFSFAIPAHENESVEADGGDTHGQLRSVVIIDDDRPSIELLTAYLSGIARQVSKARDGMTGLATVRRVRPSAVLLDIRLPGMDGWSVLKALKSDPATADVPVIVVSIVDDRSRGVELGAAAHLVKPVSRDDLLAALHQIGAVTAPVPQPTTTSGGDLT